MGATNVGPSGLGVSFGLNQGRRASRLPLAFIFRAFGALVRFLVGFVEFFP
jgi:hypothetical protein